MCGRLITGGIAAVLAVLLPVCGKTPVLAAENEIVIQVEEESDPGDGLILQVEEWEDLQMKDTKESSAESGEEETETETETESETETETESESESEKRTWISSGLAKAPEKRESGPVLTEEDPVYNLLLIGTDRRDESWNGNSDVMIVATINTAAKKICLTSFMRDLYADVPDHGVHKLNYAYAAGGPNLLIDTLESNYDLEIDNYAIVDFETMSELIDIVGGVEITVSDDEIPILNGYLVSMESEEDFLDHGGTYMLNGMQAVAYMRIRFVGNNDYQRTQRQRDVLQALLAEMKDLDAGELMTIAGSSLLLVEHDIDMFRLLKLAGGLPEYLSYEIEESRVPYDGYFVSQNEMLIPDFDETIRRLHETIYEGTDGADDPSSEEE